MAAVARHFDMMFAEPLPPARLSRLTMPVLCLQGERSTAAAQRIGALLRRLLPAACHELMPGLGHMAPVTQAAAVNTRIAAFLAAQASAVRTASSSHGALTIGQWPVAMATICQPG
jgi:pimeloyl-ACP methyl ester carboxylesterase